MPARCLGLLGIAFVATVAANAQTARVYVSSEAGDRLAAKPEVRFTDQKPPAGPTFEINEAVRFQKIDGFGASFMEAALMTLNTLPADKQEEVLRALFDPNQNGRTLLCLRGRLLQAKAAADQGIRRRRPVGRRYFR